MVGQSRQVGYPISLILGRFGANVICCDKTTHIDEMHEAIKKADILISATGKIDPFDASLIKQGCSLIDVGFNWDDRRQEFRGDVDFSLAVKQCSLLSHIPGGVGPVNAAMLVRNLVSNWAHTYFSQSEL